MENNFLATIPATKEELKVLATDIVTSVLDGEKNPLETDIKLRYLAELVEMVRKHSLMKKAVIDEAEKYPEKTFDAYGAVITKTFSSKYSYEACNDAQWNDLVKEIQILTDQRKGRETFLKGLDGSETADPETGEIISPPLRESSDQLRVTLK